MDRFSAARRQFAVTEHCIYLDLAPQGPTPRSVVEELACFHAEAHRRGPDKPAYPQRVDTVRPAGHDVALLEIGNRIHQEHLRGTQYRR